MSRSATFTGAARRLLHGLAGRRGIRPGAVLAAAACLVAAAGSAAAQVEVKYRFRPETLYDQTVSMTMTISMEMEGVPEDQAAMASSLAQGMTQEMTMDLVMDLGALGEDGSMPVEIRLEEMKSAMVVSGQRMETPTASMAGMSLVKGRMSPAGKITDMQVEGIEGVSPDMMDRLMQFIPEMPDASLSVGDSFEVPVRMAVPIPGASMDMTGRSLFTLASVTGREATFDVSQSFSLGAGGDGAAKVSGLDMRLDGGGEGTAIFDLEEGIFSLIRIKMQMDALISGMPQGAGAQTAAGAAPFRMKMNASGPVEMTLARRSAGS